MIINKSPPQKFEGRTPCWGQQSSLLKLPSCIFAPSCWNFPLVPYLVEEWAALWSLGIQPSQCFWGVPSVYYCIFNDTVLYVQHLIKGYWLYLCLRWVPSSSYVILFALSLTIMFKYITKHESHGIIVWHNKYNLRVRCWARCRA